MITRRIYFVDKFFFEFYKNFYLKSSLKINFFPSKIFSKALNPFLQSTVSLEQTNFPAESKLSMLGF